MARMKHILRWGLMRNSVRESLSEHSFDTAVIAHALAVIARDCYKKPVDPGQVAAAALFHDAPEILTGDMPAPVKYHNPEIRNAYRSVEDAALMSLLHMLPEEIQPEYRVLFSFEAQQPQLYALVKAADKISAYSKCVEELKCGNQEFEKAARQLKASIDKVELEEVKYYMERFMPAFSLTLDELQKN